MAHMKLMSIRLRKDPTHIQQNNTIMVFHYAASDNSKGTHNDKYHADIQSNLFRTPVQ